MPRAKRPLYERWLAKVEKTDRCWLWRAATHGSMGYGVLQRGGRSEGLVAAHRFAYEHFVGPIPTHLELRHSCHNPVCVNPDHLSLGTRADNMQDAIRAGRFFSPLRASVGAKNGNSKLTDDAVREILTCPASGAEIARRFGVAASTVTDIRKRRTWRHVSV